MEIGRKFVAVFCLLLVFLLGLCNASSAYVMSSANYRIQSDDAAISGGRATATGSYIFRDTIGEVSTGGSDSVSYKMRAGYQEMQETVITISSPAPVNMAPDIPGITGGAATGSATWYVITDNAAGFNMTLAASTSPAMILNGSDITRYFTNYTATSTPNYNWSVPAADAQFGFALLAGTSADAVQTFRGARFNGPEGPVYACNIGAGTNSGSHCFAGFDGINTTTVINRTSRTNTSPGEGETVNFQAQSVAKLMESGTYQATITTTVAVN